MGKLSSETQGNESPKIGFNAEDLEENFKLNDVESSEKSDTKKADVPFELDLDNIMPFIEGLFGSLKSKPSDEKSVTNMDNSLSNDDSVRNYSLTLNFGDIHFRTAKS